MRDLLVTFEGDKRSVYGDSREIFQERYSNISEAEEVEKRNKDYDYKILDAKRMSISELDNYIVEDAESHEDRVLNLHKIGELQIIEYMWKYENEERISFKSYRNYERVNHMSFNTLEECLLNALISKNLEANEARCSHELVKRMIKFE